ncbi:DNA helicase INO80 [Collichthys lucidus]|uniref:Chromatin-remodeling ATPase INO80 n=1 Tax=Collichthys lucidus TaxID=240159 RepID=A0A4U5UM94_COLLU|nr:DNA helicase INO80 [Collichthys lucidus]
MLDAYLALLEKYIAWICRYINALGDVDRRASLYLRLIGTPAPCCTLAMASCLCSLSNRKWPPLCCCCRLKAHRLARRLEPPFWSQRTESRQQRREGRKGGHGAEVRDSMVVVMAKEQWGEDGREGERIKTWGSFRSPGNRVPARVRNKVFDELTSVMKKLTYIRLRGVARGLARPVTKATRYKSCLTLINIYGVGLHKARLERALRLDSFLRQTAAIFNQDITSDDSDDSDDALGTGLSLEPSSHHTALTVKSEPCEQGDGLAEGKPLNGVLLQGKGKIHTYIYVTHILLHMHTVTNVIQLLVEDVVHAHLYHVMFLLSLLNYTDQKADKTSLYNFSKLKKNRKWLKSILLSDDTTDSDTDSDDSDFSLSREELHDMLRLHRFTRQHQSKFHSDRELHQYQYYSTGLLSTHDPFYEQQRHLLGPKKKKIKDEKKFKAKLKKVKKKKKRGEGEFLDEGRPYVTKIFAKFSHDAPLPMVKKKHLTIEQLNARRRKVWLTIAKKEIPKSFKQKTSAKNLVLTNAKKLAHQCMREVRRAAIQAQKNCKETLPRARRLTKEMMLYWKKYDKVEKEHRKRAEKEALEQRKLDEEMREAKRQQRKLNFLITQTELYAHFMSGKASMAGPEGDAAQEEILRKLEDTAAQRQIDIGGGVMVNMGHEDYDSEHYKSQALRNAKEAYQIHQERTRMFDEEAKDSRSASLHAACGSSSGAGSGFGESYSLSNPSIHAGEDIPQPTIFNGKLKGYQLKGMNWLANLYEQGINGILADEMGLGKTVQSIALLAHLAERDNIWGPFLIISPASTLNNWHQEFTRFVPKFKVLPYWGNPHDRKVIRKFWSQLWALLHFIMPTLFDSHEEFNEWFSKDIESHAENKSAIDENQLSRLHMILKPFMLRRIKKDVENELSDKIEILTYCQLTSRQRLLYQALRNKISIEDLLQSSMGSAQQSHSTTSSLMNLVMQFRKVCNHPDLFERQETRSPFHMSLKPYIMSKFLYRCGLIQAHNQAKNKLLQVLLSPFSPNHIQQSLFHRKGDDKGSCFSFLRFIDVSPAEMSNLMLQGTLARWLALFLSLKAAYRLHYQRLFSLEEEGQAETRDLEGGGGRSGPRSKCLSRKDLILWLNRPTNFPNTHTSSVLQDLVFTPLRPGMMGHADVMIHSRNSAASSLRPCQRTLPPKFLLAVTPRVTAVPMERYCDDRSAEYEWRVTRSGGGTVFKQCFLYGSPELASDWCSRANAFHPQCPGGVMALYPRHGWSFIRIPAKWQEASPGHLIDGHKTTQTASLTTSPSDSALRNAALNWHRVATPWSNTIVCLSLGRWQPRTFSHSAIVPDDVNSSSAEYMVYRKHTYMRLDGSSKISERRDMVADFQSRTDIFVFLLSTRAGGLGINLTAADTVIFYDSDWNPTVDQQAMDRAHRLGQTKQVTVYRLICQGTIEERILQRAKEKSEIQRVVISGGNFKPDTLKPKEVVSLLLDDDELEKKLRQRQEEKRQQEESSKVKERKRKREKYAEKKKNEESENKRKKEVNLVISHAPSADNSNLSADGDDSFISVEMDSAMPSPFSEISLSSELQPGSLPPDADADESSSDMLVIVDDPVSSAHQSRATNSPSSVSGSVSDNMNGVSASDAISPGRGRSGRSRGRPKGSGGGAKSGGKGRGRKSTAGSAAAMAGAMAGAAAASAAAYAAYGYSVSKANSFKLLPSCDVTAQMRTNTCSAKGFEILVTARGLGRQRSSCQMH